MRHSAGRSRLITQSNGQIDSDDLEDYRLVLHKTAMIVTHDTLRERVSGVWDPTCARLATSRCVLTSVYLNIWNYTRRAPGPTRARLAPAVSVFHALRSIEVEEIGG